MPPAPIKILILTANPSNTDRLRLDQEVREIEAELLRAKSRDNFELISKWAVRIDDLARALLDHNPQIIHFSGHGGGEDGLALEDDTGKLQLVKTEALTRLFKLARNTVKCVLLNACYSQVQATSIHQHIDCVIGMNEAIGDKAAIQFTSKFYQALAAGRSFQYAYDFACTILDLSDSTESSTPQLLNRNEADNPFAIAPVNPSTPDPQPMTPEPAPKNAPKQSQSFGNISIGGGGTNFAVTQSGGDVKLNQSSSQTTGSNADRQAALDAIAQLKQLISTSSDLNPIEKATVEVPAKILEAELQKPQPDKSIVDQAIAALKKGLDGVITLAEPVAKVAALVAQAWVGLL